METSLRDLIHRVEAAAKQAVDVVTNAKDDNAPYGNALAAWEHARVAFEDEYNAAKVRSSSLDSHLEALKQLENSALHLRESVDGQKEELSSLGDPLAEHVRLREDWLTVQRSRSIVLEEQCKALTSQSGGLIRATLRVGAGLDNLREQLSAAVRGSGVRADKLGGFFASLLNESDPLATWELALEALEAGLRGNPINSTLASHGLTAADVQKMIARLTPEGWLGLALAAVEDYPVFEYQTKPAEYIAFRDASARQQATALLRVLLNQTGPPLMIDQPEDDLDSEIVLAIVEQIWSAKSGRQLIFTSHNPNLVVNGDAELVICCATRAAGDHSGGRIKLEGAIDIPNVRQEITTVMEGGERAFRLRKEKYGF